MNVIEYFGLLSKTSIS